MLKKKDFLYVVVVFYMLLKSFTKQLVQNIDKYRKIKNKLTKKQMS